MKVAYLCSRYPAVSHTFVLREVAGLRRGGIDVYTFTVRRTPPAQLLSEADRAEDHRTTAILPAGPLRLLGAHLSAMLRAPARYLAALGTALWRRPLGLRAALWHLFYFAEAAILAAELRRRGIRHVHAHFANVAANVARLAARMSGGTWSMTLHGLSDFADPIASGLRDKIRSAAFVVCVSDFGRAQALLQADPEEWPKIHRVYCGIDTDHFQPPAGVRSADGPLRLLNVARLGPEKGHSFLIAALAEVRRAAIDATLTLVGDGPLRSRLERQVYDLQLENSVTFAGAVGQDRILDYYHNADIFVLPSLAEGLPVVLMEAMACGLPVIASRIYGIPELVESGVSGVLVAPTRIDSLAQAIVEIARDPQRRGDHGRAGRSAVQANFDQRATMGELVWIFTAELSPVGEGSDLPIPDSATGGVRA